MMKHFRKNRITIFSRPEDHIRKLEFLGELNGFREVFFVSDQDQLIQMISSGYCRNPIRNISIDQLPFDLLLLCQRSDNLCSKNKSLLSYIRSVSIELPVVVVYLLEEIPHIELSLPETSEEYLNSMKDWIQLGADDFMLLRPNSSKEEFRMRTLLSISRRRRELQITVRMHIMNGVVHFLSNTMMNSSSNTSTPYDSSLKSLEECKKKIYSSHTHGKALEQQQKQEEQEQQEEEHSSLEAFDLKGQKEFATTTTTTTTTTTSSSQLSLPSTPVCSPVIPARSLKSKRSIQMECESTKEENVIIENNQEISEQELFSKKDIARISTKKFCISPSNACCLWDFDVFGFEEKDLFPLLHSMFAKLNCIGKLCVPQESLIHFMYDVHFHYFSNPYHNFRPAIDVLQSTFFILIECEANKFFSDLEIFSMAIAAFVHDVGHTGFSNAFLVNTSSPLALCYNDKSVLENFHCSLTFSLLRKAENDIFSGIDLVQRRLSRQIIVDCILATDLSLHWDLIGRFDVLATRVAAEMESLEYSLSSPIAMSSSERTLFMQQIIKCADISNPARCFRVAKLWAERVQQEFFLQGDKEKQLELTVSPFMDRANPQLAKMQISFIDTFVNPSFEVLSKMIPKLRPQCKQLEENRSRWQSKLRQ